MNQLMTLPNVNDIFNDVPRNLDVEGPFGPVMSKKKDGSNDAKSAKKTASDK